MFNNSSYFRFSHLFLTLTFSSTLFSLHSFQIRVCLYQNSTRIDPSYSDLFKPLTRALIPFPKDTKFLISISVYKDVERVALDVLVKLMGAKLSHSFSRENTHLLCQYQTVIDHTNTHVSNKTTTKALSYYLGIICLTFLSFSTGRQVQQSDGLCEENGL